MTTSDGTKLLGRWRTDRNDRRSLREYGDVSLCFEGNGKLTYTVHLPNKEQIMHLTYRVEGAWLVIDQPSSPQEQRTEFFFTREGQLAVKNESTDPPTLYARQSLP